MIFYPANSYISNEYVSANHLLREMNVHFMTFERIDESTTRALVRRLQTEAVDFFVVFPFVLLQLCLHIERYRIPLVHQPKNINLSGEYLLENTLTYCKSVFSKATIKSMWNVGLDKMDFSCQTFE